MCVCVRMCACVRVCVTEECLNFSAGTTCTRCVAVAREGFYCSIALTYLRLFD